MGLHDALVGSLLAVRSPAAPLTEYGQDVGQGTAEGHLPPLTSRMRADEHGTAVEPPGGYRSGRGLHRQARHPNPGLEVGRAQHERAAARRTRRQQSRDPVQFIGAADEPANVLGGNPPDPWNGLVVLAAIGIMLLAECRRLCRVPHSQPGLLQRLEQQQLQLPRASDRAHRHPALAHPLPECHLPRPEIRVAFEQALRQYRILVKQEHQSRQHSLRRDVEFQFRIGHIRLVAHRRPVPQPDQAHVDIAAAHCLPAVLRRGGLPRREVLHIRYRVPSSGHRVFRGRHERTSFREPRQLRSMAKEHPPRIHHHSQELTSSPSRP